MIAFATLPSLSEPYVLKSLLELKNINVFIPNEVMGGDVVALVPSAKGSHQNRKLKRKAIALVTKLFKEKGWQVESVEGRNCGYD